MHNTDETLEIAINSGLVDWFNSCHRDEELALLWDKKMLRHRDRKTDAALECPLFTRSFDALRIFIEKRLSVDQQFKFHNEILGIHRSVIQPEDTSEEILLTGIMGALTMEIAVRACALAASLDVLRPSQPVTKTPPFS